MVARKIFGRKRKWNRLDNEKVRGLCPSTDSTRLTKSRKIIIIIITFINCNWVITRWQCLLYMSASMQMVRTNMKMVNTKFKT